MAALLLGLAIGCGAAGEPAENAGAPNVAPTASERPDAGVQDDVTSGTTGDATTGPEPGTLIGATAAAVVAGVGALLLLRRRRSPTIAAGGASAVRVAQPDLTGPPTVVRPEARDVALLSHTLREVATTAPSAAVAQQIDRLLDSGSGREELLMASIRFRDQLSERDPASANRLLRALNQIGVEEIVADGERFDAHSHEAIDRVAAPRHEFDDHVAETTRPGYRDHGRAVRLPQVVVYRSTARGSGGPSVRDGSQ